ncbi:MAG: hypothetical protein F6K10_42015 [Moorea sp. SIO2B7]|nr:hypothetical protein [Moorena sp. SIO2B7]
MQAYLGVKFHSDNRNRPLIESITEVLAAAGYQTVCIVRDLEGWGAKSFAPSELMERTFAIIEEGCNFQTERALGSIKT